MKPAIDVGLPCPRCGGLFTHRCRGRVSIPRQRLPPLMPWTRIRPIRYGRNPKYVLWRAFERGKRWYRVNRRGRIEYRP